MARIVLGRDQSLTLDGVVLEGTREFDVDMSMATTDITSWWHGWKSTLPIAADITVKLLIYWQQDFAELWTKFNVHPPDPMRLTITNVGFMDVVPTNINAKGPINGVMAWEVTLRLYTYGAP